LNQQKTFDVALYNKQIGGNGIIVIVDVSYIIAGVFFGRINLQLLFFILLVVNMFTTCILYHNFLISRGDMCFELNTEKIVYFPTTRYYFLWNKYAKTMIFLIIQEIITLACLGLGYLGSQGQVDQYRVLGSMLIVFIGILLTSGVIINVMHAMPLGIYFAMFLIFPLIYLIKYLDKVLVTRTFILDNLYLTITVIVFITIIIWLLLLWLAGKVYEKIKY
jgi:hypothetical protein